MMEIARPTPVHVHRHPPWDSDHEGLWRLQHHWGQLDDRRKQLFAQMAIVTWQYMYGSTEAPCPADDGGRDGDTLGAGAAADSQAAQPGLASSSAAWPGFRTVAQLLSLLSCNCHTVCDEELRPLGIALYPTGALVNHSCNPNTVQTFRGRTLLLKALKALAPGDEITIAYIELAATRQERREMLAESYFFDINTMDAPPPLPPLSECAASTQAMSSPTGPPPAPPFSSPHQAAPPSQDACAVAYHQPMEVDGGVSPLAATDAGIMASANTRCPSGPHGRELAYGASSGSCTGSGDPSVQTGAATPGAGRGSSNCSPLGGVRPPPFLTLDVSRNAQLHVYYTQSSCQPPWRTDPRDNDLTRVEIVNVRIGCDSGSSSRSQGAALPLPGGFIARLVTRQPSEPEEEQPEANVEEEERQHVQEGMSKGQYRVGLSGLAPDAQLGDTDTGNRAAPSTAMSSDLRHAQFGSVMVAGERVGLDGSSGGAAGAALVCRSPSMGLPGADGRTDPAPGPAPPHIELLAWGPWLADLVRVAGMHSGSPIAGEGPSTSRQEEPASLMGQAAGPGPAAAEECRYTTHRANTPPHPAVAALMRRCVGALQLAHQADTASGSGNAGEAVSMLQRAMKLLDGTTVLGREEQQQQQQPMLHMQPGSTHNTAASNGVLSLGPNHILRLRLRAQLLKAAIDLGSGGGDGPYAAVPSAHDTLAEPWKMALQVARTLEPQYRLCYPHPAWPNMSLHYATLAKLEMLLGQPYRALRAASQALEGLRLTYGGTSSTTGGQQREGGVVEQMVRTAREAEAELQARAQAGAERWGERCEDEL
ncbi:hypothetical protein Vretifemale_3919 [Volvox reticuliferus]|nr:hypothetical protein Vretifemale_3919 [Volvox reticuliferus]